ncbi:MULTISPECIES: polysaccharide export protein EpsE [Methylococcus]|jgi:polysaccharide export outer membrane protein|uniref:Putative capsular polysaccharide export protein n=1 Tax=Methylococcus capsulatus (strain ATCC 33009 / NCIMB 11132 / Bath) TaxID=243233 RepID=Q60CF9_METCA|nr:polysaccharide export protein EpsE [Methylococcus capsulatus]AAU90616.1 putative capsular polysaccharide export protein [Methylococcus capsulatus str. Bath]
MPGKISSGVKAAWCRIALVMGLMAGWGAVAGDAPLHEAGDYRLGPGDVVRISVFNYPELAIETRISQTGNITFPLTGPIAIGDLTAAEAEGRIAGKLRQGGYISDPHVTVVVSQFKAREVAVMGQVRNPGKYPIERQSRVLDMLAAAGGVTTADAGDTATLLRANGEKLVIDLNALFEGSPGQNPEVAAGDTLFVPKAPQFYVYGEVQRPGAYRLQRGMTVSQAISAAGGLTPRGTDTWPAPIVKRRDANGVEQETTVDGSYALQPDDVLYLRERWF